MAKTKEKIYDVRDEKAPDCLELVIQDVDGNVWGKLDLDAKIFSSGSKGFYATGKIKNPANPLCKYQIGCNMTLIGSKPHPK